MVRLVKMYDYPKFVESMQSFSIFLKREKDWHEDVLNFLNILLITKDAIGNHLSNAQSSKEYLTWCYSEEGVKLCRDVKVYAASCKRHYDDPYFNRVLAELLERVDYLISERCIQFYTEA